MIRSIGMLPRSRCVAHSASALARGLVTSSALLATSSFPGDQHPTCNRPISSADRKPNRPVSQCLVLESQCLARLNRTLKLRAVDFPTPAQGSQGGIEQHDSRQHGLARKMPGISRVVRRNG